MLETADIDKRIVELTGKTRPKALFIPTASGDPEGYMETFKMCYGQHFGCQTRVLKLIHNPPAFEEMSALVLDSDLIYVGGGNTYRMMKIWRRLRIGYCISGGSVPRHCAIGSQRGCDLLVQIWSQRFTGFLEQRRVGLYPCQGIGVHQCCILSALSP